MKSSSTTEEYADDTEEVFADEKGVIFVKSDNGTCFQLSPRDCIGPIEKRGTCRSLGKFKLTY